MLATWTISDLIFLAQELIVDPKASAMGPQNDHPLSLENDSKWNIYFKVVFLPAQDIQPCDQMLAVKPYFALCHPHLSSQSP